MRMGVFPAGVTTGIYPIATRTHAMRTAAMLALGVALAGCRDSVVEPVVPEIEAVERDRAALAALYNATDGENWEEQENWLADGKLDQWQGVVTDSVGRVLWLTLTGNGLKGTLPPELGIILTYCCYEKSYDTH